MCIRDRYNSTLLGIHNYYRIATLVNIDFHDIAFNVNKYIKQKLKKYISTKGIKSKTYEKFYGDYNFKTYYVGKVALFPILGVKFSIPYAFKQEISNYTKKGRELIHEELKYVDTKILRYIMENPIINASTEYNDNRISLYTAQKGVCAVSKEKLSIGNMEVHHKLPRKQGGNDEYANLMLITRDIHKLIHATKDKTILEYLDKIKPTKEMLDKINKLRSMLINRKPITI